MKKGTRRINLRKPEPGELSADIVRANIRKTRKDKGLSAQKVAEKVGISRPFYTQLEGGTRRLSVDYLLAISKGLGVDVRDLLKI